MPAFAGMTNYDTVSSAAGAVLIGKKLTLKGK